MTDIANLISAREKLNTLIKEKINTFLLALHRAGSFAPTVTQQIGYDTIEEIDLVNDDREVCVNVSNCACGTTDYTNYLYPVDLVNSCDEAAIKTWLAEKKAKEEEAKQDLKRKTEAEQKRCELEQLQILANKHGILLVDKEKP